ncbi:MAG: histone H1/H5 family protein [Nitrosomonadaceae bacterium]
MSAASPAKSAKPKKVVKKAADHPKFIDMIVAAIAALKERKGSSRHAIAKHIKANNNVNEHADTYIKSGLRKGVVSGTLKQVKGTGASGSFKLAEKKVAKPKKKAADPKKKKVSAKKPAAKKAPKKKAPKKAAKKPASKKKPAAKKPAKKAPKKKAAAKKSAKK